MGCFSVICERYDPSVSIGSQGRWRNVIRYSLYFTIRLYFKATDLGSISSLNTLTTWFDETNNYFGLVREGMGLRLVLLLLKSALYFDFHK